MGSRTEALSGGTHHPTGQADVAGVANVAASGVEAHDGLHLQPARRYPVKKPLVRGEIVPPRPRVLHDAPPHVDHDTLHARLHNGAVGHQHVYWIGGSSAKQAVDQMLEGERSVMSAACDDWWFTDAVRACNNPAEGPRPLSCTCAVKRSNMFQLVLEPIASSVQSLPCAMCAARPPARPRA